MLSCMLDVGPLPAVVALTLLGPGDMPVLLAADLAVEPHGGPVGRRRHGEARELLAVDVASGRLVGAGPHHGLQTDASMGQAPLGEPLDP